MKLQLGNDLKCDSLGRREIVMYKKKYILALFTASWYIVPKTLVWRPGCTLLRVTSILYGTVAFRLCPSLNDSIL
jgi:hypothetical protein